MKGTNKDSLERKSYFVVLKSLMGYKTYKITLLLNKKDLYKVVSYNLVVTIFRR